MIDSVADVIGLHFVHLSDVVNAYALPESYLDLRVLLVVVNIGPEVSSVNNASCSDSGFLLA